MVTTTALSMLSLTMTHARRSRPCINMISNASTAHLLGDTLCAPYLSTLQMAGGTCQALAVTMEIRIIKLNPNGAAEALTGWLEESFVI